MSPATTIGATAQAMQLPTPHSGHQCLALFPGAFKPPHEAHLAAVLDLAARPDVDRVVVIISNRSRRLAGGKLALDANVAHAVWSIYLQELRSSLVKVRLEIAEHTAVQHALGYFDRATVGDTLLFCLGEVDHAQDAGRFKKIAALSVATGVRASMVPVPTGSQRVRAVGLRQHLARGIRGRNAFEAELPSCFSARTRARIWSVCHSGLRTVDDIVAEKVRALIEREQLGEIERIESAAPGKPGCALRVRLSSGPSLIAKYAGDAVPAATCAETAETAEIKPRRRLGTERRALTVLRARLPGAVALPCVVCFDKASRTLLLSEVCGDGQSLADQLSAGVFDPSTAAAASRFLARCHGLVGPIRALWGEVETDRRHWLGVLERRTIGLDAERLSQDTFRQLIALLLASKRATGNHFMHLGFCPKNIRLGEGCIGVIDFERCSCLGDPAYDLGSLLGDYLHWGLVTSSGDGCDGAVMAALNAYRGESALLWAGMRDRVVAFAGARLLATALAEGQASERQSRELLAVGSQLLVQSHSDDVVPALVGAVNRQVLSRA